MTVYGVTGAALSLAGRICEALHVRGAERIVGGEGLQRGADPLLEQRSGLRRPPRQSTPFDRDAPSAPEPVWLRGQQGRSGACGIGVRGGESQGTRGGLATGEGAGPARGGRRWGGRSATAPSCP